MSESGTDLTFADTQLFSGIYFYTYVLICLVIIAGAYYFARKVRLYYETYKALEEIESHFGIVTLGINALEIKYNVHGKGEKKRKRARVSQIEIADVRQLLDESFTKIETLVAHHKTQLMSKIDKIEEKSKNQSLHDEYENENEEMQLNTMLETQINIENYKKETETENQHKKETTIPNDKNLTSTSNTLGLTDMNDIHDPGSILVCKTKTDEYVNLKIVCCWLVYLLYFVFLLFYLFLFCVSCVENN